MLLNKKGIYCFECKKYYDPYIGVYLNVWFDGSVTCLHNHLLGSEIDFEWRKIFNQEVEEC